LNLFVAIASVRSRRDEAAGVHTLLDVLDAEQELLGAQTNLAGARHDEVAADYRQLAARHRTPKEARHP
jgi:outer membrane protein TolC